VNLVDPKRDYAVHAQVDVDTSSSEMVAKNGDDLNSKSILIIMMMMIVMMIMMIIIIMMMMILTCLQSSWVLKIIAVWFSLSGPDGYEGARADLVRESRT